MNLVNLTRITGDVAGPTPATLVAGRLRLDAAISAADADVLDAVGGRVSAPSRSSRRRRWGVSALVGAAVTAAALIALPLFTTAPASAEEVMLAAADAAALQVDEGVEAQYWHVVSEVDDHTDTVTKPYKREIWLGRSRESVLRQDVERATPAAAPGTAVLDPASLRTEGLGGPAGFGVGTELLTWGDLEALPTDAAQLGARLRAEVGEHPSGESGEDNDLWESVTGLLRESPASPALRRALWQVAASIPDVELLGPMNDAVGRPGVAVERNQVDQGWDRTVYILDPGEGTLLEYRIVDALGNVHYRSTELEQGPSDTAPAAQPPVCGPDSEPKRSC